MFKKLLLSLTIIICLVIMFNHNCSGFSLFNNMENDISIIYLDDKELLFNGSNYRYFGSRGKYIWILKHTNYISKFGGRVDEIEVDYYIHNINNNIVCINGELYMYNSKLDNKVVKFTKIDNSSKCTSKEYHDF